MRPMPTTTTPAEDPARDPNSRPDDLPWPPDVVDAITDLRRRQAVRNARRRQTREETAS